MYFYGYLLNLRLTEMCYLNIKKKKRVYLFAKTKKVCLKKLLFSV